MYPKISIDPFNFMFSDYMENISELFFIIILLQVNEIDMFITILFYLGYLLRHALHSLLRI